MPRVTSDEVKAILRKEPGLPLETFITTASSLVDELLTDKLGEGMLKQIELYLSAHFYHVTDPNYSEQKIDESTHKYRSKIGMGLHLTHFGQQAMILDVTGTLAEVNVTERSRKFEFGFLGDDLTGSVD